MPYKRLYVPVGLIRLSKICMADTTAVRSTFPKMEYVQNLARDVAYGLNVLVL